MTAHYIHGKWNLVSATLCCRIHKEKHSGDEIAASLKGVLEDYALNEDHMMGIVTDTAANINAMGTFGSI